MNDRPPDSDQSVEDDPADARARRLVLKSDFFIGIGVLLAGLAEAGTGLLDTIPILVVVYVLTVSALFLTEHDAIPGVYPPVVALASLVVIVVVVAGAIAILPQGLSLIGAAALVGFGSGIISYRVVFGLHRDVPAVRLARVR